jgi:hypothetical protein
VEGRNHLALEVSRLAVRWGKTTNEIGAAPFLGQGVDHSYQKRKDPNTNSSQLPTMTSDQTGQLEGAEVV